MEHINFDNIAVWEVGEKVRDAYMGLKNKDIDYAVEAYSYEQMKDYILYGLNGKIFVEKPEFVTIRALVNGYTVDYVLCRKDGTYSDGRHPDEVWAGTILDDLARRDFTMNAMAIHTETGELFDPYNGKKDIDDRIIRCVGNTEYRMGEDALRLLRAVRFSITKTMSIHRDILRMFSEPEWMDKLANVSQDRIQDEVYKMFSFDTKKSISFFGVFPMFAEACFSNGMWLEPTHKEK